MAVLCWKQQKGVLFLILENISSLGAETCLTHCIEEGEPGRSLVIRKEEAVSSNALIL